MIRNYDEIKRELTKLLSLIQQAEVTFKDARQKLIEPIERKKEKATSEIELYRQKVELQLEEKRKKLIELAKSSVGDEARNKKAIIQLAEEKSQGFPWLVKAYDDYFRLQDLRLATYLETKLTQH